MRRYGFGDRRAARRVMDAAGAFVVARRLFVREADLLTYEDALRVARQRGQGRSQNIAGHRTERLPKRRTSPGSALRPGWWRADGA